MRKTILGLFLIGILALTAHAQNGILQGYIFEDNDQGHLGAVEVRIMESSNNQLVTSTTTNKYGIFLAEIPVGKTYTIQAQKQLFGTQTTTVVIKPSDKRKKVYTQLKMVRKADPENIFTEKTVFLSNPVMESLPESYGIDSKQINPSVNPDGVALASIIAPNDPYAEITNATRLVDENYEETADQEAFKYERIPTAYQPNIKIKVAPPTTEIAPNRDMVTPYIGNAIDQKIETPTPPQFGETMVASANNFAHTHDLPTYYTGYKIEFMTSLTKLPSHHEIFKRHGNIVMERRANGIFSFLLGDFERQEDGQKFLEETMLNRYPGASLIGYENGQRIVKKKLKKTKTKVVSTPPR